MKKSNRMVSIELKFFANDMNENNEIIPGHIWDQGTAHLLPNENHNIGERQMVHFHSLLDIAHAIETLLWESDLKVHVGGRSINYIDHRGTDHFEGLELANKRRAKKKADQAPEAQDLLSEINEPPACLPESAKAAMITRQLLDIYARKNEQLKSRNKGENA